MSSPIVDKLPDISSSLVGLLGALYAVYAAYGYQKIWEAHNKKKRFARLIEVFRREGGALETLEEYKHNLFTPNYWNQEIIKIFKQVTHIGAHANSGKNIYDFTYRYGEKVTDTALLSVFRSFTGTLDFALDALNSKDITNDSLRIFRLRIADIKNIVDRYTRSIITFADLVDTARNKINNSGLDRDFPQEVYKQLMDQFIRRVDRCYDEIIPEIYSVIEELSTYENAFQLRKATLWSIVALAWILIFGVFIPPAVVSIANDLDYLIPPWCKYILLIFNIIPYGYIAWWVWQKIIKLPYR